MSKKTSEAGTLRKLRAANSKLMTSNLELLIAIREADTETIELWRLLQQHYERLEKAGVGIPKSCSALMNDASPEDEQASIGSDNQDGGKHDGADSDSEPKRARDDQLTPPTSSALSMRNVLNDDEPESFEHSEGSPSSPPDE